LSVLAALRHATVEQLQAAASQPPQRTLAEGSALASLRGEDIRSSVVSCQLSVADSLAACPADRSHLHVLCRRPEQIAAALQCGVSSVIADFQDLRENSGAVDAARDAGAKILLATPRIQKPQAADIFQRLANEKPDGLLVRNLAGLGFCRGAALPAVADFSLHAVNDLAFAWLCRRGACRVTAAYDLNVPRLLDLASAVEPSRLEVVVDRHTPLFHTEYCLCARGDTSSLGGTPLSPSEGRGVHPGPHALRQGSGRATQSVPCREYEFWLRDRRGVEHPVWVDADCRTTVFHAEAQSLAAAVPDLLARGVRHYRIELLSQTARETRRTIEAYQKLL
jgi:putative protease